MTSSEDLKKTTFLDLPFRFSGLISYVRFVVDGVKFLVGAICLRVSHLGPLQGPLQPLFLSFCL